MPDVLNSVSPNYTATNTTKKVGVIELIKSWGGINTFLKKDIVALLLKIVGMSGVSESYTFITETGVDTYLIPNSIGRITVLKAYYDGKLMNTLVAQDWTYNPSTREFKFNIDTFDNVECVIEYY